jgi:hypothetical membrane protein
MTFAILRIFGFSGAGMILLAVTLPALAYRGRGGERYSLFNHFISELGEVGVSKAAWIFNGGLFLGGLLFLPFVIGLGMALNSPLGWLGCAAGIVAVLGVAAVGLLPMNNLKPHTIAALTYFRSGLVMVFFFGLAILFQSAGKVAVPQVSNVLSLLSFLAYGTFLVYPRAAMKEAETPDPPEPVQVPERPRFFPLAMLEWSVFFSTMAWLLGMAFLIKI